MLNSDWLLIRMKDMNVPKTCLSKSERELYSRVKTESQYRANHLLSVTSQVAGDEMNTMNAIA